MAEKEKQTEQNRGITHVSAALITKNQLSKCTNFKLVLNITFLLVNRNGDLIG